MDFVPSAGLIRDAFRKGYAVPSFCVWNAETMIAVLEVAADCRAPVLLMCGPGEFPVLPPTMMAGVARVAMARRPARAALHLDHGDSVDQVKECLAAGFTSVMLDFSRQPVAVNIEALREVAALAKPEGASVEGELGAVGRADNVSVEGSRTSELTDPEEARRYVEATGVDMLAVSIGNAHGIYTQRPCLDFARLEAIRDAVALPLVLHGGSGTPEEDLKRAIALGIAKVNIASELTRAVRESLHGQWDAADRSWMPVQIARAMGDYAAIVEKWIRMCGAAGRA